MPPATGAYHGTIRDVCRLFGTNQQLFIESGGSLNIMDISPYYCAMHHNDEVVTHYSGFYPGTPG